MITDAKDFIIWVAYGFGMYHFGAWAERKVKEK